jgi:hypothetical protein
MMENNFHLGWRWRLTINSLPLFLMRKNIQRGWRVVAATRRETTPQFFSQIKSFLV